jgi:hypothetical protein
MSEVLAPPRERAARKAALPQAPADSDSARLEALG